MFSPRPAQRLAKPSICLRCESRLAARTTRSRSRTYSTTPTRLAEEQQQQQQQQQPRRQPPQFKTLQSNQRPSALRQISEQIRANRQTQSSSSPSLSTADSRDPSKSDYAALLNQVTIYGRDRDLGPAVTPEPHHLHIYAHKHNCHITLTNPAKEPIISLSAGNIGFKHTARGSFDAGFQLAAYVMRSIQEKGLLRRSASSGSMGMRRGQVMDEPVAAGMPQPIRKLEIVLRGFGQAREAAMKILLGNEGRLLRPTVVKVSDATRLKFGGTRSQNPRRL